MTRAIRMGILAFLLSLGACDNQRIAELEEGVATEADVMARFGTPENVWDSPEGKVFEFNRQPAGQKNYMITIGPDGKMAALRQVLAPRYFAQVQPGMAMEDLRKLLGKPAKVTPYKLKNETEWDWRWQDEHGGAMVFTAVLNSDLKVVRSGSTIDPATEKR
jgi:hypothetical protein